MSSPSMVRRIPFHHFSPLLFLILPPIYRKQQSRGWKFRENFKLYYSKHMDEWRAGPAGLAAAQQQCIGSMGPGVVPPLPEGWEEKTDPCTTQRYYHNEETNERTWARPGFIPAAPAPRGPPMGGMRPGMGRPGGYGPQPTHNPYNQGPPRAPPMGGEIGRGVAGATRPQHTAFHLT